VTWPTIKVKICGQQIAQEMDMEQNDSSEVRWRKRVVTGASSFGPGMLLVDKLSGVLVRCPKCGQLACTPYWQHESLNAAGGYYLNCRACCRKRILIGDKGFAALLQEVLPATYTQLLH
jgi:hypothetical protein